MREPFPLFLRNKAGLFLEVYSGNLGHNRNEFLRQEFIEAVFKEPVGLFLKTVHEHQVEVRKIEVRNEVYLYCDLARQGLTDGPAHVDDCRPAHAVSRKYGLA